MNISLIGWSHLGSLIVKNLQQPWHNVPHAGPKWPNFVKKKKVTLLMGGPTDPLWFRKEMLLTGGPTPIRANVLNFSICFGVPSYCITYVILVLKIKFRNMSCCGKYMCEYQTKKHKPFSHWLECEFCERREGPPSELAAVAFRYYTDCGATSLPFDKSLPFPSTGLNIIDYGVYSLAKEKNHCFQYLTFGTSFAFTWSISDHFSALKGVQGCKCQDKGFGLSQF